jgi:hypothetical protein
MRQNEVNVREAASERLPASILTAALAARQYVAERRYEGCRMFDKFLDKFIAACEASERAAARSWLNGPFGVVDGIWAAVMVSILWVASPIITIGTAVLLLIAWRYLGWAKAYSAGFCIGAMLTWTAELSLFFAARRGWG